MFDDQIAHVTVVGDEMPNLPYPKGTEMSVRLAHVFEMEDGKIVSEIAYEIWREEGAPNAADQIREGCVEVKFDAFMPRLFAQPRKSKTENSSSKRSSFQVAVHQKYHAQVPI